MLLSMHEVGHVEVVTTATLERGRDANMKPMVNQYVVVKKIGKGQHGDVFKGLDQSNGRKVVRVLFVAFRICALQPRLARQSK